TLVRAQSFYNQYQDLLDQIGILLDPVNVPIFFEELSKEENKERLNKLRSNYEITAIEFQKLRSLIVSSWNPPAGKEQEGGSYEIAEIISEDTGQNPMDLIKVDIGDLNSVTYQVATRLNSSKWHLSATMKKIADTHNIITRKTADNMVFLFEAIKTFESEFNNLPKSQKDLINSYLKR